MSNILILVGDKKKLWKNCEFWELFLVHAITALFFNTLQILCYMNIWVNDKIILSTKFITYILSFSVYTKSLCHITEVMSGPLIQALENRLETNKSKIQTLQDRKKKIEKQLREIDDSWDS